MNRRQVDQLIGSYPDLKHQKKKKTLAMFLSIAFVTLTDPCMVGLFTYITSWLLWFSMQVNMQMVPWILLWVTKKGLTKMWSTRWFKVTFFPLVGGHQQPLKRVTWTHHPKKVTIAEFPGGRIRINNLISTKSQFTSLSRLFKLFENYLQDSGPVKPNI